MVSRGYVCVFFETIWVSWAMTDRRHELCVSPMGVFEWTRLVDRLRNRDWPPLIMAAQQEQRISQSSSVYRG
jgi:hypothetical protein